MNIRSGLSILGLALAMACGGGGGSSSSSYTPPPPPPNTVQVGDSSGYGSDMLFTPATLTVSAGTTVTFRWQGTHTLTSYAYNGSPTFPGVPNPGQGAGTSYSYQFNTPGTYYYYCEYHGSLVAGGTSLASGMAGKVVVN